MTDTVVLIDFRHLPKTELDSILTFYLLSYSIGLVGEMRFRFHQILRGFDNNDLKPDPIRD